MGLLDDLQMRLGLEYLSDLRFYNYKKIKAAVEDISAEDYTLAEWNDAVEYLTNEPMQFASACEAREFLLKHK